MKFRLLIFCLIFCALVGCSEDVRVSESEIPRLSSFIHLVPGAYSGNSYTQFPSVRSKAIAEGESAQLVAEVRLNGSSISDNSVSDYVDHFEWIVGDAEPVTGSRISRSFPDSGIIDITLRTVDFFNDTISDTLTLYVTTPLYVTTVFPEDGYSAFDPLDSAGLMFKVQTQGINSWQEAVCLLYLSPARAGLISVPLDTVPCNGEFSLRGPIFAGDSSFFLDTSYTLYWAVSAQIPSSQDSFDSDTSEVHSIHTKLIGTELSRLTVPIRYRSLSSQRSPNGTVVLQNHAGDTLATEPFTENSTAVIFTSLSAGDSLQISVYENTFAEYAPASVTFDLSPSEFLVLDTLVLIDSVSPVRSPARSKLAAADTMEFYLFDEGSGIATHTVAVTLDADSLKSVLRGNVLRFVPSCDSVCALSVEARDYAGNSAAPVTWKLKREGDSLSVLGPFNPEAL